MEAKRRAVQALVLKKAVGDHGEAEAAATERPITQIPGTAAKESTKVARINCSIEA
jgi:hypothetical protein